MSCFSFCSSFIDLSYCIIQMYLLRNNLEFPSWLSGNESD